MRKKSIALLLAVTLTGGTLLSSCIGSFPLFHKVLDWNQNVGEKWVNELVFLVIGIVPVYGVATLIDVLILNSIEFWTGTSPVADLGTKTIETKNGIYTVETKTDGYKILKEGEEQALNFVFDKADNSWSMETAGETHKILKFSEGNDIVVMYLPNVEEMNVSLDQAGVLAFQQVTANYSFFAAR
jgi:hypothetical protein